MQVTISTAEAVKRLTKVKTKIEAKRKPILDAQKKAIASAVKYQKKAMAEAIVNMQADLAALNAGKPIAKSKSLVSIHYENRSVGKKKYRAALQVLVSSATAEQLIPERWSDARHWLERYSEQLKQVNEALDVLSLDTTGTVTVDTEVGWGRLLSYGK